MLLGVDIWNFLIYLHVWTNANSSYSICYIFPLNHLFPKDWNRTYCSSFCFLIHSKTSIFNVILLRIDLSLTYSFLRLWWSSTITSSVHILQLMFQYISSSSCEDIVSCCFFPCCIIIRFTSRLFSSVSCTNSVSSLLFSSSFNLTFVLFCSSYLNLHSFASTAIPSSRCTLEPFFSPG